MDLDRYNELKGKIDRLRRDRDRSEVALSQVMDRLMEEFDIGTMENAREKLAEMEEGVLLDRKKFNRFLDRFEKKWGERLGDK